jgi:4-hydroxy-tetrahydrodipicolinate reductase
LRIGVVGAAGRVGSRLVETILSAPGLELAASIVSARSNHVGQPVSGGGIEYRAADSAINARCDVMIDFSTPASTMALQNLFGTKPVPFVIGTTGLTARQVKTLRVHARHRPVLMSDNFAAGLHGVEMASDLIARALPGALTTRSDDRRLRRDGTIGHPPFSASSDRRSGDITEFHYDAGGVEVTLIHRVNTLAIYADGALSAAHWLLDTSPPPGLYSLADTFRHSSSIRN